MRRREMKLFRTEDYIRMPNPTPGAAYKPEILASEPGAKNLGGIFALIPPGTPGVYHYHQIRESILIIISGEAIETVEGKEIPVKAGDVLFIPPGEKHAIENRSNRDLRYIEFFTHPPGKVDFVEVK
jgi:mannose-6-phosphate isomerase-like protein (cupin superfamily)